MASFNKTLATAILVLITFRLAAQDYPQWPADKPETEYIAESQSRDIRIKNGVLPQEVEMQDKMRFLIYDMMQNAAKGLHWHMAELSEFTNNGPLQSGGTPYALRSPRGIGITFQFIVNTDSLEAWKNYQANAIKINSKKISNIYSNTQSLLGSPLYRHYQDSEMYFMKLYLTYDANKNESASKKMPRQYYLQKVNEFKNKTKAITQPAHDTSEMQMQKIKNENETNTFHFRNCTIVQVMFRVNNDIGIPVNQSSGPIQSTFINYTLPNTTLANLYTFEKKQTNTSLVKWNNVMLILLGNFLLSKDSYGDYPAGFTRNRQDDEHSPKKIKSDKVQTISINISGSKINIEKMVKFIDIAKLNSMIVKN